MHRGLLLLAASAGGALAFLPAQNPPWPAQWDLINSTISMVCNSSGWFNTSVGSQFGIVSIDWSNAKAQWANAHPMDCEERLLQQAVDFKTANPASHVFVYRNLVKVGLCVVPGGRALPHQRGRARATDACGRAVRPARAAVAARPASARAAVALGLVRSLIRVRCTCRAHDRSG